MAYTWGYLKEASLAKLDLDENEASIQNLIGRFVYYANEVITQISSAIKPKRTFAKFTITKNDLFISKTMPSDFISFGDDVCTIKHKDQFGDTWLRSCTDEDIIYKGYNNIQFLQEGEYEISYNSRWYTFSKDLKDSTVINVPDDILECIPSYIAHQCYKIDDEVKSSIYRNEYEMLLSRIDDTNYKSVKSLHITGGW